MYHIKECIVVEGVYDKIKLSQIVDGVISFLTNHFSTYILAKEKVEPVTTATSANSKAVKTGDSTTLFLWTYLMLIGLIAFVSGIIYGAKLGKKNR